MTVAELQAVLATHPPEQIVRVEGCHLCGTTHPVIGVWVAVAAAPACVLTINPADIQGL